VKGMLPLHLDLELYHSLKCSGAHGLQPTWIELNPVCVHCGLQSNFVHILGSRMIIFSSIVSQATAAEPDYCIVVITAYNIFTRCVVDIMAELSRK